MASISKLPLNLRKKLLFVSVLPIEKVISHHIRYIKQRCTISARKQI